MTKKRKAEIIRAAGKSQGKDEFVLVAPSGPKQGIKKSWMRLDPD
jgi:hypothetical protein